MSSLRQRIATRAAGFVVVAVPGVWEAWRLRFIQDDAYISCRYADNLARGIGLVWNEGDRVEGYTNFLWTVILTVPHLLHLNAEIFAIAVGLVLFTGTLGTFYILAGMITTSWIAAAIATLALGLFPSFAAFATGGLETQLQTLLLTAIAAFVYAGIRRDRPSPAISMAIGFASALAMLTRMDSFMVAAPLTAIYAWLHVRNHGKRNLTAVAPALLIPVIVCSVWLAWKLAYYGALLPNSYNAKVEEFGGLTRRGIRFVLTFVQAYAFYLPLASVPVGIWLAWERRLDRSTFAVLTTPLVPWLAYVVLVGGDFMEYRFLVPVLPLAFLVTYWVMIVLDGHAVRAALFTTLVIAGGMVAYCSPKVPKPLGSPLPLAELAVTPEQEWYEIGTVLGTAFAGAVRPSIAVVPSGVIPYRSRLPAVDMLGLNDPEVTNFIHLPYELVGHRRLAPLDLLERRRVNFLIAFPVVRARPAAGERYRFVDFARRPYAYAEEERLRGRRLIELPLSGHRVMYMLYLTEDPIVTRRIDELGWAHYPLE